MAEQALVISKEEFAEMELRTQKLIDTEASQYLQPLGITPEYFAQATLQAIHRCNALVRADRKSFAMALLKCAQRGLMPDGESAVLVPFKGEVSLIVMYPGMADIIRRNIPGIGIEALTVWKWDDFTLTRGDDSKLTHVPKPLPEGFELDAYKAWSNIVGAYCLITLPPMVRGALPVTERHWMWRAEIERIRNRARGSHTPGSPWKQYPSRMAEKTVMRNAFNRLPSRSQIFASFNPGDLDDYSARTVPAQTAPAAAIRPPKPRALLI